MCWPRPCLGLMYGVSALASEFFVGDAAVYDMSHNAEKASQVGDIIVFGGAIVEAKHLLVYVPIQVEWFDADVCPLQSALSKLQKFSKPFVWICPST